MPQVTVTEDAGQNGSATATFSVPLTLTLDNGNELDVSALPDNGDLMIGGGSTLNLQGGRVNLGSGTVNLVDGSITNGTLTAAGFNLQNGTISANMATSGTGQNLVTVAGGGYVALTGNNSFSGVSISDGTLAVNSDAALGNPDGAVAIGDGGTLQALGSFAISATRQVTTPSDSSGTAAIDTNGFDLSLPGGISGGGLTVIDSSGGYGTLDLSGSQNPGLLGNVTLDGGFVAASNIGDLGSLGDSTLIFNGGGLRAVDNNLTIPSGKQIEVGAGGASFDSNGFVLEIDAAIASNGSGTDGGITVMDSSPAGNGVVLLNAENGYQGGTTIASGTLQVSSPSNLGNAAATITFNGGMLQAAADLDLTASISLGDGGATIDSKSWIFKFSLPVGGDLTVTNGAPTTDSEDCFRRWPSQCYAQAV
jgi:autotransporter-associated beta strand protein